MRPIYLDHHATTPLDPRVLAAMTPWLTTRFGNPDSRSHRYGREAREATDLARAEVARLLGARDDEVIFTSGATESITLALVGTLGPLGAGAHVITQATEHRATLEVLRHLESRGVALTVLPVDAQGRLAPEAVREALRPETRLVSVMLANNEVGTAQPIAEIAAVCAEREVGLHVDAAQGLGYLPLDLRSLPIDAVSCSAHKLYGPMGVGALFLRRFGRLRPEPLLRGGGQEKGLRSGTSNVPGIVGFGAAARILLEEGRAEAAALAARRDRLASLLSALPGHARNGDPHRNHPGNLSVRFEGISADRLVVELEPELALSTGSACASGGRPSHVLVALGLDDAARRGTVRLGLGRSTTDADVERAGRAFEAAVRTLRARLDDTSGTP